MFRQGPIDILVHCIVCSSCSSYSQPQTVIFYLVMVVKEGMHCHARFEYVGNPQNISVAAGQRLYQNFIWKFDFKIS